eukprot:TRINITY_DN23689_c0_g1_i2.p1 TRINITY_DN23689_c0_g1~~TRINITY_DN23689_c0_g1_i2.p1  ORF type:complete len:219 (-),score=43.65 TRINITY_DN23689_c0_g1_i2:61-717(-)
MSAVREPGHRLPLLEYDASGSPSAQAPSLLRKARYGQAAGTVVTFLALVLLAASQEPAHAGEASDSRPQGVAEAGSEVPVIILSEAPFTVPAACLSAMLLGALASCCCCGACSGGASCEGCNGCCGSCCEAFVSTVLGALGLAKNGVPVWSLAAMWQGTLGSQPGACPLFVKALIVSGLGFLGGVTLTGSAAAAGLQFCQRYNEACGGCVGDLPKSIN